MTEFTPTPNVLPPTDRRFFDHGMVPAQPGTSLSLIVIDVRQLKLTDEEATKLEEIVRDTVVRELEQMRDLSDAKLINFATTAKGFAIE